MIYQNVKKVAESKGITIYRIEKDTKLSNGIIAKWGKTANQEPSASNLKKVADYLQVEMDKLLD